jgi:diguanylate cyclase (GGDEF)-like protein/PAS domain S-box-containing protein
MSRWATRLVLPLMLLAATALATYSGFRADDEAARQRATSSSVRSVAEVTALTDGLSRRIEDLAGLFAASDHVSAEQFAIFSRSVVRTSQASALGWAAVVPGKDRRQFEREHDLKITSLTPSGKRVVSPRRSRYVVSTYAVRRDDRDGTLGVDIDSSPERHRALVAAVGSETPVATPPIKFADGKQGISLYMPVYGVRKGLSADGPIGYTIGAFQFDDLAAALKNGLVETPGIDLSFKGRSAVALGKRDPGGQVSSTIVNIAGQNWVVKSWAPPGGIGLGWIFLVSGLLLTILVTLLTNLVLRANRDARRLAEARSREHELMLAMQERKSAAAEKRFAQVFDSATIGMALVNADGRYTKVNNAFSRLVARPESDLLKLCPHEITHPEDVAAARDTINGLFGGLQTEYEVDKRYIDGNGRVVWVALRAKVLMDAEGRPDEVLIQTLDISKRRAQEDNLRHMADHDGLTGLSNRRAFNSLLGNQLSVVRRYGRDGALLSIDLDNFKAVNDVHGHSAGDAVLRRVAAVIREQLRESDVAGRIGGDEFSIMVPKGSVEEIVVVAERLVDAIAAMGREHSHDGVPDITCSVGVAMLTPDSSLVSAVSDQADAAMYEAKAQGRNRFVVSADGMAEASGGARS